MESKGTTVLIAIAIIGLIIGGGIGYTMAPTKTIEVEVPSGDTITVEVPGETVTIEVKVPALSGTIPIGYLYSNTGHIDSSGPAANIAIEEVNEYVEALGLDVTFELVEECAEGQATIALEKFQSLVARGVKVVAGFNWSSQCKAVKDYADENNIVVFSDGSTSPIVAIPDDCIFRLAVTDTTQNSALAPAIYDMGIEHIVIVFRNDAWGDGNYETMKELYEAEGGVVEEYLRYDSEKTEFSAEAAALNDVVVQLNRQYGADKVALATWSFEFSPLFAACKEYPALVDTTWFGSNGFGRSTTLVDENPDAYMTSFHAMIMGTASSSRFNSFETKYLQRSGGRLPSTYNTHVYDIIWLLCKSILEAGTYDGAIVKEVLPTVAEQYWGACGWTKLNENGDRAESSYELWTVNLNATSGQPAWYREAVYDSGSGAMSWLIPP